MVTTEDEDILRLFDCEQTCGEGLTLMMERYRERVYWHVRRIVVSHEDAEDVLQETFINAYRFIGSFERKSRLYTWLYRIATNECLKLLRSRKLQTDSFDDEGRRLVAVLYDDSIADSERILLSFQEAILRLPEKQRLVFNLRYYDELSYEDISRILDMSVGTLKTNYHYAKEKIKEFMINRES